MMEVEGLNVIINLPEFGSIKVMTSVLQWSCLLRRLYDYIVVYEVTGCDVCFSEHDPKNKVNICNTCVIAFSVTNRTELVTE